MPFVNFNGFFREQLSSYKDFNFVPMKSSTLHLGDCFILEKLCSEINLSLGSTKDAEDVVLTFKRHHRRDEVPSVWLDFSKPIDFSLIESVRLALKQKFSLNESVFDGGNLNCVVFAPEIQSSQFRLIGLDKRITNALSVFKKEGFRVIYIGHNYKTYRKYMKYCDEYITGLDFCKSVLSDKNIFAFLGYDNYWMHVASSFGLRCYVIQRRKILHYNLLNHVCTLNNIYLNNNKFYI